MNFKSERRQKKRYTHKIDFYYHYAYDVETKVKYEVVNQLEQKHRSKKFSAISRNISSEGMCFVSNEQLHKGETVNLELSLPNSSEKINMLGEVRWSKEMNDDPNHKKHFDTGVKLISVNGQSVEKSIYFDKDYHVEWSVVLESVLGTYRILAQNKKLNKETNNS